MNLTSTWACWLSSPGSSRSSIQPSPPHCASQDRPLWIKPPRLLSLSSRFQLGLAEERLHREIRGWEKEGCEVCIPRFPSCYGTSWQWQHSYRLPSPPAKLSRFQKLLSLFAHSGLRIMMTLNPEAFHQPLWVSLTLPSFVNSPFFSSITLPEGARRLQIYPTLSSAWTIPSSQMPVSSYPPMVFLSVVVLYTFPHTDWVTLNQFPMGNS